jgi:fructose-1,6-bisphosphatase/inositol monophosphatase family enzyme
LLLAAVPALLERASRDCILPRFRQLSAAQVEEKTVGELVTVADRDAERFLAGELTKLVPGSQVVGEEACSAEPALLGNMLSSRCWVIDPLDGTGNFVAGRREFGILLGYLEEGSCLASWIYHPLSGLCFSASADLGARVNGEPMDRAPRRDGLRGIVKTRFLPPPLREQVLERANARLSEVLPGVNCAAFEYPEVASGALDFILYWRTLAWDHVPCVHFLAAAGGYSARIDGSAYDPNDSREGLLVARDEETWHEAKAALFS